MQHFQTHAHADDQHSARSLPRESWNCDRVINGGPDRKHDTHWLPAERLLQTSRNGSLDFGRLYLRIFRGAGEWLTFGIEKYSQLSLFAELFGIETIVQMVPH